METSSRLDNAVEAAIELLGRAQKADMAPGDLAAGGLIQPQQGGPMYSIRMQDGRHCVYCGETLLRCFSEHSAAAAYLRGVVMSAVEKTAEFRKSIQRRGSQWCVVANTTGRNMGCYDTKAEAIDRLIQVEAHKAEDTPLPLATDPPSVDQPVVPPTAPDPPVEVPSEVGKSEDEVGYLVSVLKFNTAPEPVSPEEHITFGVVLVPNEPDAQGDIYSQLDVRRAAYSFMERSKGAMRVSHKGRPVGDKIAILESYVSKQEEVHNGRTYPSGTWFISTRYNDPQLWADVKAGVFTGYSIGGSALRQALR